MFDQETLITLHVSLLLVSGDLTKLVEFHNAKMWLDVPVRCVSIVEWSF